MNQGNLNLTRGRELRDAGMEQAIFHAGLVIEDWQGKARRFLRLYIRAHSGPFMAEDARVWASANGCPEPPSLRAWGGIIAGAARSGHIVKVGIRQVSNPNAHCANAALWRKT